MEAFIDIHSHVLYGVDDGSSDERMAVSTLKQMRKLGTESIILTPHYCKRRGYETSLEKINSAYKSLCDACVRENIGIKLYLGTEMEYSTDSARYIREGRINTLADTKYILMEFPPYVSASSIPQACIRIMQTGLIPVIAHIERYTDVYKDFDVLYMLREMGVKIQVNIASVSSAGFKMKRFLKRLFAEELADFLASDVHSNPLDKKEMEKCRKFVLKCASFRYYKRLMYKNAKTILNGGQI